MRVEYWIVFGLGLALTPSAGASSLLSVDGDLEYLQSGTLEGYVSTDAPFLLHSRTVDEGVPTLRQFLFRADEVSVVALRDYGDESRIVARDLVGQIAGPEPDPAEEVFTDVRLRLLSTTPEWDFLLFSAPAPGGPSTELRSLGAARFDLRNSVGGERLVSSEAPSTHGFQRTLRGAGATSDGQLHLATKFLSTEARGSFNLVLYGATLQLLSHEGIQDLRTGHHTETQAGPLGVPVQREVNEIILIRVYDGNFRLLHEGPGLDLYSPHFFVNGGVRLPDASGQLSWQDVSRHLDRAPIQLEGQLDLASRGVPRTAADGQRYGPLHVTGMAQGTLESPWAVAWGSAAALAAAAAASGLGLKFLPGLRRWLLAFVGLFSMVGKGEALRHEARNQLLEHVRNNPGTTLSAAQRDLRMGWGTIGYHVSVLERLGYLVSKRVGGKRLLFAQGQSRLADPGVWGALQNPSARHLTANHFQSGLFLTTSQAAQSLGCTPQYAGRLLRRLASLGLLEARGTPHRAAYGPTPLLLGLHARINHGPELAAAPTPAMALVEAPVLSVAPANADVARRLTL